MYEERKKEKEKDDGCRGGWDKTTRPLFFFPEQHRFCLKFLHVSQFKSHKAIGLDMRLSVRIGLQTFTCKNELYKTLGQEFLIVVPSDGRCSLQIRILCK